MKEAVSFRVRKNSIYNHEIIPHVNQGTDGTLDFLKNNQEHNKEQLKFIDNYDDCEKKITFSDNDILVVHNNLFLHGRKKFTKKINRKLYRIQILAN